MPVTCCEKERKTRFCPDCGAKLVTHPLDGLLVELRANQKRQETKAENMVALLDNQEDQGQRDQTEANRKSARESAAKYGAWADALAALIQP